MTGHVLLCDAVSSLWRPRDMKQCYSSPALMLHLCVCISVLHENFLDYGLPDARDAKSWVDARVLQCVFCLLRGKLLRCTRVGKADINTRL